MRTLNEALSWWPLIEEQATLSSLKDAIKTPHEKAIYDGLRSVCWKTFLLFEGVDRAKWSAKLQRSRDAYTSLRTVFLRAIENSDELDDPLSENNNSAWITLRKDEELRSEIYQDVERCMPDNFYFRQPNTQNMLLDILFVWSKLNPEVSYRQGMHEVLAPILWVVERDAVDPTSIAKPSMQTRIKLVETMFNAEFIAHDSFTLFSLVMQHAKSSYQVQGEGKATSSLLSTRTETPMVLRSQHIIETLLEKTDPILATHLKTINVIPQLFLMRWVRLLFGREFSFDQVLSIWDRLFAEDPSAECVDLVCLAMILRIRWQLIDCDNNSALSLLLHYPEPSEDEPPHTFVDDALYLKTHLNSEGGHDLIFKYTNRAPPVSSRPSTPAAPYRPFSPLSGPRRFVRQSGGFDKLLQEAAREVYTRGEKWGLNQVVRDAVGEVRKNVQGLQITSSQSHHSSDMEDRKDISMEQLLGRVDELKARNKSLAKMLEGAVSELWQRQKDESEGKLAKEKIDDTFTLAIAKVQLVQVYLEDASLPLPTEESSIFSSGEDEIVQHASAETNEVLFDQDVHPQSPSGSVDVILPNKPGFETSTQRREETSASVTNSSIPANPVPTKDDATATSSTHTRTSSNQANRPPLTQSSFSWILGQDESTNGSSRNAFLSSASPFTMPGQQQTPDRRKAARTSAAFLFGDADDETPLGGLRKKSVSGKAKDRGKMWKDSEEEEDAEDVFKLGPLRSK